MRDSCKTVYGFFSFSTAGSRFSSLQNKLSTRHAVLDADYVLRELLQLLCWCLYCRIGHGPINQTKPFFVESFNDSFYQSTR